MTTSSEALVDMLVHPGAQKINSNAIFAICVQLTDHSNPRYNYQNLQLPCYPSQPNPASFRLGEARIGYKILKGEKCSAKVRQSC